MKIRGSALLPATREQVWELLTDPARLSKCLPGCEALEAAGPDRYKVSVKFGVAAITGKYAGSVELAEKNPPASLRIRVEGKGIPGFMKGDGQVELLAKGGQTEVRYAGEAQVGGVIASVGQRMIESVAKKIIRQFFESAASHLQAAAGPTRV